jgi:hypothetical protein
MDHVFTTANFKSSKIQAWILCSKIEFAILLCHWKLIILSTLKSLAAKYFAAAKTV